MRLCFRGRLRETDPDAFDDLPSTVFDESQIENTTDIEHLWPDVKRIHDSAKRCLDRRKDESAWTRICWDVLDVALREAGSKWLEVNSVYVAELLGSQ